MKLDEIRYLNKIKGLRKLNKVYEIVFVSQGVLNVRCDLFLFKGRSQENEKLTEYYSELIEHIEAFCHNEGSKDTKYLDGKLRAHLGGVLRALQGI